MLPEEVTKLIGQSGDVRIFEVEKGAIRRFAEAVDDPNPLYWDEEYAKNSGYGSIIAPPGFFGWPAKGVKEGVPYSETMIEISSALTKAGYTNPAAIDARLEYNFFSPVRSGDTLAATSIIKDIVEREGRTGKMAFIITETTYTNQRGDLVAKARSILIRS